MTQPALIIMAKQPAVGHTKTRLCPPLTPTQAAALYEALLLDTIELGANVEGVQLAVAVTPPQAMDYFKALSPADTLLVPVAGADIGDCLNQVLSRLLAEGHPAAIAINSDGPTLPVDYLHQAIAALNETDLVLGPSRDGGYYLIGLKRPQSQLFANIEWSTERVAPQTLARAEELGLRVAVLPAWYDVDTFTDLQRIQAELTALPAEALPHTRRFFADYPQVLELTGEAAPE
jgi:rSAM/selenodomain-associated transferase 1